MKKFRKGDVIALKKDPKFIYVADHPSGDGGYWRGTVHPDHIMYRAWGDQSNCLLGKDPKAWKVIERGPSKKDQRIETLTKQLEVQNKSIKELSEKAAEALERFEQKQLDFDLAMLGTGYVSLAQLRRHTLRDVMRSYDGVSPFSVVRLDLKHPVKGADGEKYMTEFLRQLTQQ